MRCRWRRWRPRGSGRRPGPAGCRAKKWALSSQVPSVQSSGGRLKVRALVETNSAAIAPGSHWKCTPPLVTVIVVGAPRRIPDDVLLVVKHARGFLQNRAPAGSSMAAVRSQLLPGSSLSDVDRCTNLPRLRAASERSIIALTSARS